jgi:hypothetical protein
MLANPGVALTWWDQAVWAERLGYAQQGASLSAAVFRALRESNLRLLQSVPRARWVECYGVHETRGRQTVEEFVRLEAAHDLNHLRQIDRILGWAYVVVAVWLPTPRLTGDDKPGTDGTDPVPWSNCFCLPLVRLNQQQVEYETRISG